MEIRFSGYDQDIAVTVVSRGVSVCVGESFDDDGEFREAILDIHEFRRFCDHMAAVLVDMERAEKEGRGG